MKSLTPVSILILAFTFSLHAEMREWTSSSDTSKKIKGELQRVEGDMIVLKMMGGKLVKFELSKLSKADQIFARTGKEPAPKPTGPESTPAEVIESFVYDETPDEVYLRIKKNPGLRGGVNEILRGRTGLNDKYYISPGGVRYGLFFDYGKNVDGLEEVSLQSEGFSEDQYDDALGKTWQHVRKGLESKYGKAEVKGAYPAKDVMTQGISMSTDVWKTEKGEVYLGIGRADGKFSCVIRIRENGFLAP